MSTFKKGMVVTLVGFTGIRLANKEIGTEKGNTVGIIKADGSEMLFDSTTGKQINAKNEKYANSIIEAEEGATPKVTVSKKSSKAPKAEKVEKAPKVKKVIVEDDGYEEV